MAGELPPNPEDGELYLPSDIAPEVGIRRRRAPGGVEPGYPRDLACVHHLVHQLAAFGLLRPAQPFPADHLSPGWIPGFGPAETRFGYGGFRASAGTGVFDARYGSHLAGSGRANRFGPGNPVQADGFRPSGAGVLKGQLGRGPKRSVPVRAGGLERESGVGGTGVFLPRANDKDVKDKPNLKVREQQKQVTRNVDVGKQERSLQLPADMGLPQDWTY